ncbi:hypothetical protein OHV05_09200 [Kitasatospora sp. NBC_00070]|uniref:hypothetical protein n=1 Tax=Kitasatospora sp. NBC_00070 TaxID=2975962 RepID=UPI003243648E
MTSTSTSSGEPDTRPTRRPGLRRALVAVAATALIGAAGTAAIASAAPTPAPAQSSKAAAPAVQRWEYRWALAQPGGRTVGDLEQLGKEGWEVVAPVNEYTGDRWNFLLKRALP